jgi:hypothetical protein
MPAPPTGRVGLARPREKASSRSDCAMLRPARLNRAMTDTRRTGPIGLPTSVRALFRRMALSASELSDRRRKSPRAPRPATRSQPAAGRGMGATAASSSSTSDGAEPIGLVIPYQVRMSALRSRTGTATACRSASGALASLQEGPHSFRSSETVGRAAAGAASKSRARSVARKLRADARSLSVPWLCRRCATVPHSPSQLRGPLLLGYIVSAKVARMARDSSCSVGWEKLMRCRGQ